jgi:hypothetical protein
MPFKNEQIKEVWKEICEKIEDHDSARDDYRELLALRGLDIDELMPFVKDLYFVRDMPVITPADWVVAVCSGFILGFEIALREMGKAVFDDG